VLDVGFAVKYLDEVEVAIVWLLGRDILIPFIFVQFLH
jgi:hypothetical protein